jgi:hypothetical protein
MGLALIDLRDGRQIVSAIPNKILSTGAAPVRFRI